MNKSEEIKFWKRQKQNAEQAKALHLQGYQIAAQIESEAESRLDALGNKSGRGPQGSKLSEENILKLKANLTR